MGFGAGSSVYNLPPLLRNGLFCKSRLPCLAKTLRLRYLRTQASGKGIDTIRLPSFSQDSVTFAGEKATVSGWGDTSKAAISVNSQLMYADVIIMLNDNCRRFYKQLITNLTLCACSVYASNICKGDSGGPLTITVSDGVKTQVGIAPSALVLLKENKRRLLIALS
ncbi:Hypothetical predicted protein [Cloeon dipterum]|uniref:Peptidase S1 domain-containing protein n=1 Tax=Cloeon dipterum TaxID=197152 RepID=A0A8S1BQ29_9INSE|nr:Hypothetical predicted protein [Cloeon dipterum]